MSNSILSVNVIRKTREIEAVRERLIASELSVTEKGWVNT